METYLAVFLAGALVWGPLGWYGHMKFGAKAQAVANAVDGKQPGS